MSPPNPSHTDPPPAGTSRAGASEASRLAALRAQLDGLLATLRLAQALTESGERIDLTGLDDQIGRLCAGALDLPPTISRALRADMAQLGLQISALTTTLRTQSPGCQSPD